MRSVGFQLPSFDFQKKTQTLRSSYVQLDGPFDQSTLELGHCDPTGSIQSPIRGVVLKRLAVGAPWLTGGFTGTVFHHVFHPSSVKRYHIDFWSSMYNVATNKTCSVETVKFVIFFLSLSDITICWQLILREMFNDLSYPATNCNIAPASTCRLQKGNKKRVAYILTILLKIPIEPWAAFYSTTIKWCQY